MFCAAATRFFDNLSCKLNGKYFGFNHAEEQIEDDIKQKLIDAFNKRRG